MVNEAVAEDLAKLDALIDKLYPLMTQLEGSLDQLVEEGLRPMLETLATRGVEMLKEEGLKRLAKETGVDPRVLQTVYQLPQGFDFDKVMDAGEQWGRQEAVKGLAEAGIPPSVAEPLLRGDPDAAVAAGRDHAQSMAKDFLREKGVDSKLAGALAAGKWDNAAKILQDTGSDKVRDLVAEKLIPRQAIAAVEEGDIGKLGTILEVQGGDSLFKEAAKRSGLPEEVIRHGTGDLVSGQWAIRARETVQRTAAESFNRQLSDLGVTPKEWEAIRRGDPPRSFDVETAAELTHRLGQKTGWSELAGQTGVDLKQLQNFAQSVPWNKQRGWDIQSARDLSPVVNRSSEQILSELLLRQKILSYRVTKELKEYQRSAGR